MTLRNQQLRASTLTGFARAMLVVKQSLVQPYLRWHVRQAGPTGIAAADPQRLWYPATGPPQNQFPST